MIDADLRARLLAKNIAIGDPISLDAKETPTMNARTTQDAPMPPAPNPNASPQAVDRVCELLGLPTSASAETILDAMKKLLNDYRPTEALAARYGVDREALRAIRATPGATLYSYCAARRALTKR